MENINVQKTVSKQGKVMLIVNNYKFNFADKLLSGEVKWRCRVPTCKAALYTVGEEYVVSKCNLTHCHAELSASEIQKQLVAVSAKRKASEDIGLQPKRIIQSVLNHNPTNCLTLKDLHSVKRSIYGVRRKTFPTLPKSCADLHHALDKIMSIVTSRDEDFLIINNHVSNIVIFSCETNLKHLCACNRIFMDGTFKYAPKHFLQLFTIHGWCNGHYIPLVFCLLKDKSTKAYANCLTYIFNKCRELNLLFQPAEVVIDFETSIHKALKEVWDNVEIIGCRFHISQSWWRKIQSLGLARDYKERTEIGKWLGYCFGLLFLGNYFFYITIYFLKKVK